MVRIRGQGRLWKALRPCLCREAQPLSCDLLAIKGAGGGNIGSNYYYIRKFMRSVSVYHMGIHSPKPRLGEVLPLCGRLVCEDVDGRAERPYVADALLPGLHQRRWVESHSSRRFLPGASRRSPGRMGLLLPNERGSPDAAGLRSGSHVLQRPGTGPAGGRGRCRRHHHLAAALRWPRRPRSQ